MLGRGYGLNVKRKYFQLDADRYLRFTQAGYKGIVRSMQHKKSTFHTKRFAIGAGEDGPEANRQSLQL